MATDRKYKTLAEFYPYYLTEHQDPRCRTTHTIGTTLFFIFLFAAIATQNWWLLIGLPLAGYGFAWFGHFVYEKNKPATFQYPLFSLASDFIMYYHTLTGQIGNKLADARTKILA
jgi:hypothetical protein